jgi:hypothetical protein
VLRFERENHQASASQFSQPNKREPTSMRLEISRCLLRRQLIDQRYTDLKLIQHHGNEANPVFENELVPGYYPWIMAQFAG